MHSRPMRALEVLSISALDLFASALGVFILMAVLLFPFYLKSPSLELELEGARQEQAETRGMLDAERTRVADAAERKQAAEARLAKAASEREDAGRELAAAEEASRAVQTTRPKPQPRRSAPKPSPVTIGNLDLVFVMDTTGSMREEIADVQRSLLSIIRVLERLSPSLRIGFVAFKDRPNWITQESPLRPMTGANLRSMQTFVRSLRARGGGDKAEPVGEALRRAVAMPWRPNALGRIVVIGDAQAHLRDWRPSFEVARAFFSSAPKGANNRRVSGIFTGRGNRVGLDYYRNLTEAGGGDLITHRGRIMESVLLSILDDTR